MNEVTLPGATVHLGNVLDVLRDLPDDSVHCVVSSPPYWGLRDYKIEPLIWGGDPACEHDWLNVTMRSLTGGTASAKVQIKGQENFQIVPATTSNSCQKCGAWRGALGLEPDPALFVEHIVWIFREVRRVLRPDGTLWLNFGDCYQGGDRGKATKPRVTNPDSLSANQNHADMPGAPNRMPIAGLKPKDLVGMPWRIAFALQADGWWLRSDIIWSKPNPMPESVTDRPTKSHEYLFLMTKAERYFYDADAIRERTGHEVTWEQWEIAQGRHAPPGNLVDGMTGGFGSKEASFTHPSGRNRRTVWTIATAPYPEAHFATFPESLVEPCIKAGTSEEGCCPLCGAPWVRVTRVEYVNPGNRSTNGPRSTDRREETEGFDVRLERSSQTVGWRPSCGCGTGLRDEDWDIIESPKNGAQKMPSGWDVENHGREGFGRFAPKAEATPRHDGERWNENNGRGFTPRDKQGQTENRRYQGFNARWDAMENPRAGLERPRQAGEGIRPITRFEQRQYASQLRSSGRRAEMETVVGEEAFAHYVRTDKSGARPIPPVVLATWLEAGWLVPAESPFDRISAAPKPVPCTVLEPFAGSGTTLAVARKLGRRAIGIELQPNYLPLIRKRLERASMPLLDELDFDAPRQTDLVDFIAEQP